MRLVPHLPAALRKPLASLVAQSPDPDGALNLLERYARESPPEVRRELAERPAALTYLVAAFGFGGLLAEAFLAEPALALQFVRDRQFSALKAREDLREDYARFSTTHAPQEISGQLVRFKRRNSVRIALKDVLGLATLAETTLELSALADVILDEALRDADRGLEKRFGQPQYRDAQGRLVRSGFSIISLGKLGGSELNYSSDIDLLFLYARDGETAGSGAPGSAVSNKEYFVRLAQAITGRLTEATAEGQVFRVDLRLRPEGDQGDLTLALNAAFDYYARRARDWELQMLIKARHSAGDARLTRAFLRGVEPYVYSAPGDFAAVESVLASRERISRRLRERRHETIDVKRHPGGIRDIEFLTQCLQRLYGAREPWVRSGGTLHALRKLNDKGLLSDRDYAILNSAYEFLRKVEHRIQLERGQQSHRLPSDPRALERLARRVGIETDNEPASEPVLALRVNRVLGAVEQVYRRLLRAGDAERGPGAFELSPVAAGTDPGPVADSPVLRLLGSRDLELANMASDAGASPRARPRLARFMASLSASPEALSLARESPAALERALEVLRVSEPLGEFLIRHPEDLAVLAARPPEPASETQLSIPLQSEQPAAAWSAGARPAAPFAWVSEASLEARSKMSLLRRGFRARALQLGANDCARMETVYESLRRWSDSAATCVSTAFAIAAEMSGAAARVAVAGTIAPAAHAGNLRVAALGLGRLGLSEFDLGSDADLIFVAAQHTSADDMQLAVHWAEKTLETLSSYTREGAVFAADTRLRPRGSEGELVVREDVLLDYALNEAQPWEALAYLKACPVAGDSELGWSVTERLVQAVFVRFASDPHLAAALRDMRRRLEREPKAGHFSTKSAPGGYYDVDFAVSYLRLRHRLTLPAGSNMFEQIGALAAAGRIGESDADTLVEGAAFLRALDHAMRLVTGKRLRGLPERPGPAQAIERLLRLWAVPANGELDDPVPAQLARVQQQVRGVFNRVLGSG
ncbi:MAG TPA: putative nucleotidyltransferase substrate binding domain-containing protein [Terriglobia bacterium]|nr:putative nucleotidyltransferase substrate binding domain-containing protein [Terriglobia bacterium]